MNEHPRSKHYADILRQLPEPTDPVQNEAFCADYKNAISIIHNLRTLDEEPSLEYYELLLRLEFLIAKNARPDLIASFLQATQNAAELKADFISQNPDLETQLKFKRKAGQSFEDQIAQSIYVSPRDPKSWNRFKYIRESAEKKSAEQTRTHQAQQRFRQVYQNYSTIPSKPRS